MNGLARKFEIHRHRDQAGAHDAEVSGNELRAIGRENADAVAAREAAPGQSTRDPVRHVVDLAEREFPRRLLATEIDDRDLVEIAVASDQVAEVGKAGHHAFGGAVKYVPRPLASSLPWAS